MELLSKLRRDEFNSPSDRQAKLAYLGSSSPDVGLQSTQDCLESNEKTEPTALVSSGQTQHVQGIQDHTHSKLERYIRISDIRTSFVQFNTVLYIYRLTQAGIFLALSLPGFFLSTRLGSRVKQPAVT